MKTSNKISIIIPIYNVSSYLERCLNSVIGQTYRNIEIILVDDGSTDDSLRICNEYARKDSRILVIAGYHKGVAYARNIGISVASGEYIGFVDPDDYIDSDMYEILYDMCKSYNVNISCCNAYSQGKKKSKFDSDYIQLLSSDDFYKRIMLECNFALWNKLWHKSLFSGFLFREDIESGSDLSSYLLIFAADRVAYLNDEKYHYTIRDSSLCRIFNLENRLGRIAIVEDMVSYIQRNRPKVLVYARYLQCNTRYGFVKYLFKIRKEEILLEQISLLKADFYDTFALHSLWAKIKYSTCIYFHTPIKIFYKLFSRHV